MRDSGYVEVEGNKVVALVIIEEEVSEGRSVTGIHLGDIQLIPGCLEYALGPRLLIRNVFKFLRR